MEGNVVRGLAAGAVGTSLLNTVTYLDMALRGRPASPVPEAGAERMAASAGVSLGAEPREVEARKAGVGALLGMLTGFAGGAAFGIVRPLAPTVGWPPAAALTGLAIMFATDAASTAMGTTDPRSWSPADWASDVVPHLAYGAGVVLTFDALRG
jgi:hypothetical protein